VVCLVCLVAALSLSGGTSHPSPSARARRRAHTGRVSAAGGHSPSFSAALAPKRVTAAA